MRLAAPDRIALDFERDMLEASNGRADRLYFRTLANNATATVGWLATHGVEFCSPGYYLSAGPVRIQPVGGGRAIVGALSRAAKRHGVAVQYGRSAQRLVVAPNGLVTGHFYGTAPNAVAVLRALVFGRIAGLEAVSYLEHTVADRT